MTQDDQERTQVLEDFSGGLNQKTTFTSDNQAKIAQNVRFSEAGSVSKRLSLADFGDTGATAVNSGYRYYYGTTKRHITSTSTLLRYGTDSSGAFATLATGLTDGVRWQFLTTFGKDATDATAEILMGANGSEFLKWDGLTSATADTDGHRTAGYLAADVGSCFAEIDASAGQHLDASSYYQYVVVFFDGTTYRYPGAGASIARSNPLLIGATAVKSDVQLTDIPLGPTGTTHRYVYRTSGCASIAAVEAAVTAETLYLCATIANNTATTYNDVATDATIEADPVPTWGTASAGTDVRPPLGEYLLPHKERIFVGTGSTSYVYYSDLLLKDYYPVANYESIDTEDGDILTGIREDPVGWFTIFKRKTLRRMSTDGSPTIWSVSSPLEFYGCVSPYTIDNTPWGLIYRAHDGLRVWNGQRSELISDIVDDAIDDCITSRIDECVGIYHNNLYRMGYSSETVGEYRNNRELILNLLRKAFDIDLGKEINCYWKAEGAGDNGELYMGDSSTGGKVFKSEKSSVDILYTKKSQFNDFGTAVNFKASGDEDDPTPGIAWIQTMDDITDKTMDDYTAANMDHQGTTGSWESQVLEVNLAGADKWDTLYWNEQFDGSSDDITIAMKTGATVGACNSAAYGTEYTTPAGSDISSETAAVYMKFRISFTATTRKYHPYLFLNNGYVIKITYNRTGTASETAVEFKYTTDKLNQKLPYLRKQYTRFKLEYSGEGSLEARYLTSENVSGTITLGLTDDGEYELNHVAGVWGKNIEWTFYKNDVDDVTIKRLTNVYVVEPLN